MKHSLPRCWEKGFLDGGGRVEKRGGGKRERVLGHRRILSRVHCLLSFVIGRETRGGGRGRADAKNLHLKDSSWIGRVRLYRLFPFPSSAVGKAFAIPFLLLHPHPLSLCLLDSPPPSVQPSKFKGKCTLVPSPVLHRPPDRRRTAGALSPWRRERKKGKGKRGRGSRAIKRGISHCALSLSSPPHPQPGLNERPPLTGCQLACLACGCSGEREGERESGCIAIKSEG